MNFNQPLPKWIQTEIKYKTIRLFGTPGNKDAGEFLIRIVNTWGLIVRDFLIVIEETNDLKKRKTVMSKENLSAALLVNKWRKAAKKKNTEKLIHLTY